jgi:hypothetical protein
LEPRDILLSEVLLADRELLKVDKHEAPEPGYNVADDFRKDFVLDPLKRLGVVPVDRHLQQLVSVTQGRLGLRKYRYTFGDEGRAAGIDVGSYIDLLGIEALAVKFTQELFERAFTQVIIVQHQYSNGVVMGYVVASQLGAKPPASVRAGKTRTKTGELQPFLRVDRKTLAVEISGTRIDATELGLDNAALLFAFAEFFASSTKPSPKYVDIMPSVITAYTDFVERFNCRADSSLRGKLDECKKAQGNSTDCTDVLKTDLQTLKRKLNSIGNSKPIAFELANKLQQHNKQLDLEQHEIQIRSDT